MPPTEVATIGEVFTVRDIAAQKSWETLAVVTNRSHAFRAHYIFDQCVGEDVSVNLVYADPEFSVFQWACWCLAYENAAFIKRGIHLSAKNLGRCLWDGDFDLRIV